MHSLLEDLVRIWPRSRKYPRRSHGLSDPDLVTAQHFGGDTYGFLSESGVLPQFNASFSAITNQAIGSGHVNVAIGSGHVNVALGLMCSGRGYSEQRFWGVGCKVFGIRPDLLNHVVSSD